MRGTSAGYAVHIVCPMRGRRALTAKCFKLLGVRLNAPGRGGGGGERDPQANLVNRFVTACRGQALTKRFNRTSRPAALPVRAQPQQPFARNPNILFVRGDNTE